MWAIQILVQLGCQTMVALLYFYTSLEVKCEIYSCVLEPFSTNSLGHQHCAKKLCPEITLHLKWSVKAKQRYPSQTYFYHGQSKFFPKSKTLKIQSLWFLLCLMNRHPKETLLKQLSSLLDSDWISITSTIIFMSMRWLF